MNQLFPMSLHFFAGLFGAIGQYFYKKGGLRSGPFWENWQLGLGVLSFCVVMVLFVFSYKMGGRISAVYPAYACTFVWGALLGRYLDGEPVNSTVLMGIALILTGVVVVGFGAIKQ